MTGSLISTWAKDAKPKPTFVTTPNDATPPMSMQAGLLAQGPPACATLAVIESYWLQDSSKF